MSMNAPLTIHAVWVLNAWTWAVASSAAVPPALCWSTIRTRISCPSRWTPNNWATGRGRRTLRPIKGPPAPVWHAWTSMSAISRMEWPSAAPMPSALTFPAHTAACVRVDSKDRAICTARVSILPAFCLCLGSINSALKFRENRILLSRPYILKTVT